MNIPDAQGDALSTLVELGFKLTHFHADGVIDTAKEIAGERVMVFVSPDGTIKPPRTGATMIAASMLHGAGVKLP